MPLAETNVVDIVSYVTNAIAVVTTSSDNYSVKQLYNKYYFKSLLLLAGILT